MITGSPGRGKRRSVPLSERHTRQIILDDGENLRKGLVGYRFLLATKEKKCMSTKRGRTVNKNTLIKGKLTQKLQGGWGVKRSDKRGALSFGSRDPSGNILVIGLLTDNVLM